MNNVGSKLVKGALHFIDLISNKAILKLNSDGQNGSIDFTGKILRNGTDVTTSFDSSMQNAKTAVLDGFDKSIWLPTWDGAGDSLHPNSVYIPGGFNGYTHWIAYTPLSQRSPYPDRWECPCVAASNDGINYILPTGSTNPLDDLTAGEITAKGYFSDPDLIYNPDTNQLELWYRLTSDPTALKDSPYIRRVTSDGVAWSARQIVYNPPAQNYSIANAELVSPAVFYKLPYSSKKYRVYFNDNDTPSADGFVMRFAETDDPSSGVWTNVTTCNFPNLKAVYGALWHFSAEYYNGQIHVSAYYNNNYVLYFTSSDGINFNFESEIMPNPIDAVNGAKGLYQTSLMFANGYWHVYVTLSHKRYKDTSYVSEIRTILLLKGTSMKSLKVIDGGYRVNKEIHYNDIYLYNSGKTNANANRLIMMQDENDPSKKYGLDIDAVSGQPMWMQGNHRLFIPIGNVISTDFLTNSANQSPWTGFGIGASSNFGSDSNQAAVPGHPGIRRYQSHATNPNSGWRYGLDTIGLMLSGWERSSTIFLTAGTQTNILRYTAFHNAVDQNEPTNGVYGQVVDGVLVGKTANASVRSTTSTSYPLTGNNWYRLVVELNSNATLATFTLYAENSGTVLWTDTLATNIPTTNTTSHGDLAIYTAAPTGITTLGYVDRLDLWLPSARRIA